MAYVLDTNVFYDLTTAPFREVAVQLCEKGRAGELEIRFSPIAVIEMSSRISREPARFDQLKQAALIAVNSRARCLPDPEQRMREILHDGDVARCLYDHWDAILDTLSRAPSAGAFAHGFDDIATGTRRVVNIDQIHRFREDYERQYIIDLVALATHFNPRYDRQAARVRPTRLTESEQQALERFLASDEWRLAFRALLAARGNAPLTDDHGRLGVIDEKSAPFRAAYEWLLRKTFRDGRRVNFDDKNDYNDMHMLVYVNRFSDDCIVSSDEGVILDVGGPAGKAIRLRQFVTDVLGLAAPALV